MASAGDRHPLLLAAGELGWIVIALVGKADHAKVLERGCFGLRS
jgi:hypothetical protein